MMKRVSLLAAIVVGISYLGFSMRYWMPYGNDGIILMWPEGFWLFKLPWHEKWRALIASFMMEDHLAPMHYLFGSFFYMLHLNPVLSLNIAAKLFYLMYVVLAVRAVYEIWEDKNRALLFFSFLVINLGMTWRTMVSTSFGISAAAIWGAFIFYVRYLKRESRKDFFLFSFLFLLATFSCETAFVGFPLFLIFALFYSYDDRLGWSAMLQRVIKHGIWIGCLLLPYLLIHFYVHGSILPGSRLGVLVQGNPLSYYLRMLFSIFSEWCFEIPKALIRGVVGGQKWENSVSSNIGLPSEVYTGAGLVIFAVALLIALALAWGTIRFRLIRDKGWILWAALAVQIGLILITGRYEDGMWIIAGLTFWMAITDIVYYLIKKEAQIPIFVLGVLVAGIVVNIFVNPFDQARKKYQNAYETSTAAYRAINESTDRIKIVRLKGSGELIRSSAFWIGNKIYHRDPGLWFYPQQLLFFPRSMYMEFYPNVQDHPFDFFKPYLKVYQDNKETFLFQDSASFFRVYLDAAQRKILRVVPIATSAKATNVDIYLPDLSRYRFQFRRLRYMLNFAAGSIVKEIHYAGSVVNDWRFLDKSTIEFYDASVAGGNLLVAGEGIWLNDIEVFIDGDPDLKEAHSPQPVAKTLLSRKYLCTYTARSSDGDWIIWGTADPQEAIRINPFFMEKFRLDYKRVQSNRILRQPGEKFFDQVDGTLQVIDICDVIP